MGPSTLHQVIAASALSCILGRNDPARSATTTRPLNSPMVQLMQSTQALRSSLRREYPDWSPEADMQRSAVRRLIGESMDYREISRRALGETWDQLTETERNEFTADLGTLIEHRYLSGEMSFGPDARVTFEREVISDRGTASVYGTLVARSNARPMRMSLEYRLLWKNGHWVVYDLVTDGESLLENYRAQFDRIIARESFAGLMRRMRRAELRYQSP
jgi:phospholipid transport system substrate-binding protein